MIHIHPYKLGSRSAMALKGYLTEAGIRTIVSHRLMSQRKRMIVGWGAKSLDFELGRNILLNPPEVTKTLSCKKRFFDHATSVDNVREYLPRYTSDRNTAIGWGTTVVIRDTTSGSGGDGISIVDVGQPIHQAPLYTEYEKKTHEYRLHILGGEVKEIQRKVFVKTEENPEPKDWRVRNHTMGFIFQTEQDCPEAVRSAATTVAGAFQGLDFVAMDVIYHKPTNKAFVLEGNTAPGLEGPRLNIYGDFLIQKYKELM